MTPPQNNSEFSLAFSLLNAWSLADDELRRKLETLIAEYAARKPEFVNELKHVADASQQLQGLFTAAHARPPQPTNIESLLLQYMTRKEGGTASA